MIKVANLLKVVFTERSVHVEQCLQLLLHSTVTDRQQGNRTLLTFTYLLQQLQVPRLHRQVAY